MKMSDEKRVIEVVKDVADVIPLADGRNLTASQLLQLFLFPPQMQYTPVGKLSGGEKRRLYLLTVLMKNPNFLILDEPTNDLDVFTLSALEDYLLNFPGCLVIVSHDRYFLDKLVDHLFLLDGKGNVHDLLGSTLDFRAVLSEASAKRESLAEAKKQEVPAPPIKEEKKKPAGKISFKDKHEFETLEKNLPLWEEKKAQLEAELLNATDHVQMEKIALELGALSDQIDNGTMRWLELSEMM
jgi:ATP-binding cassette subfamily F protein uup